VLFTFVIQVIVLHFTRGVLHGAAAATNSCPEGGHVGRLFCRLWPVLLQQGLFKRVCCFIPWFQVLHNGHLLELMWENAGAWQGSR